MLRSSLVQSLLLLFACFMTTVLAGKCTGKGCYICGKAVNRTPWTMLYTTDPGDQCRSGDSCCRIYNWNDGHGGPGEVFRGHKDALKRCTHRSLAPGKSAGGNTCRSSSRTDVDAITFADRDYVVWQLIDGGRIRQEKQITRGVWVRFHNTNTAECETKNGKPYCYLR